MVGAPLVEPCKDPGPLRTRSKRVARILRITVQSLAPFASAARPRSSRGFGGASNIVAGREYDPHPFPVASESGPSGNNATGSGEESGIPEGHQDRRRGRFPDRQPEGDRHV